MEGAAERRTSWGGEEAQRIILLVREKYYACKRIHRSDGR